VSGKASLTKNYLSKLQLFWVLENKNQIKIRFQSSILSFCELEFLFPWQPGSTCWGLVIVKWDIFFLVPPPLLTGWHVLRTYATIRKYQTFWIGKYCITLCEIGCEQWYSSLDLSYEQWLQHRLLSCRGGNTKHFSLVPEHRHQVLKNLQKLSRHSKNLLSDVNQQVCL